MLPYAAPHALQRSPRHLVMEKAKREILRTTKVATTSTSPEPVFETLEPGYVKLYSHFKPQLQGGDYTITATQVIKTRDGQGLEPQETKQDFSVVAPQFQLPQNAILSVYPPREVVPAVQEAGSGGVYTSLPSNSLTIADRMERIGDQLGLLRPPEAVFKPKAGEEPSEAAQRLSMNRAKASCTTHNKDYLLGAWRGVLLRSPVASEVRLRVLMRVVDDISRLAEATLASTSYQSHLWLISYWNAVF
ncbi:hypothetical protein QQX98_004721 [Neonectria punicea]|uniref:Uncharacterized protein n=1 Tax=Neonectria punicea TaxID=979145 RepID=A0ABR1H8V0_9HYPO